MTSRIREVGMRGASFRRGQGLVEFALILPVLLLFMLGIMEFGRVLYIYTEVSNAAQEALRAGAATLHRANDADRGKVTAVECNEILNRAYGTLALTPRSQVTITVEYRRPPPAGAAPPWGCALPIPRRPSCRRRSWL
jgi:Flp pilus assembly protein TadG